MTHHHTPSTRTSDTLRRLDLLLHFVHNNFRIAILIITVLLLLARNLHSRYREQFPSTISNADTTLIYPSFDSLDKLRRPKLHDGIVWLLIYAFPATVSVCILCITRKIRERQIQGEEMIEPATSQQMMEIWQCFHIASWKGYHSPQQVNFTIQDTFLHSRAEFGIAPWSSSSSSSLKAWILQLFVWFWGIFTLALGAFVPFMYLRPASFLVGEPRCRLYPELFSSSAALSSKLMKGHEIPLFPNSTVLVREDGQVFVNGTILYTQEMDGALFAVCMMESVAYFGGGLVGLLLVYQVVPRWCWFGVAMVQKVRRRVTAEDTRAAKEM